MHIIKPRAYGIETEYACVLDRDGEDVPIHMWPSNFLKHSLYHAAKDECVATSDGRAWHPNGSLTYVDIGEHPEHSTPECRTIRDAVTYSQAGDRLVRDYLSAAANDQGMNVHLFKNNIACADEGDIVTFGCHENYLLHCLEGTKYRNSSLATFIATRQIFAGSGYFDDHGHFYLSQRAYGLAMKNAVDGTLSVGIKAENVVPRFHMVYGDSSLLDVAEFLKLGTMSLVISLIEARQLPDIASMQPKKDLLDVARYGAKQSVPLCSGGLVSALDVQFLCLRAAQRFVSEARFESDETAVEMELVLNLWEQALNAIKDDDVDWMVGRIDWATKRWLAHRELSRISEADRVHRKPEVCKQIDIIYHSIMKSSVRDRIYARFPERRITSDTEIDSAMHNPPQGTRAQYRSALVWMAVIRSLQSAFMIDWHAATLRNGYRTSKFDMQDPLKTYEEDLVSAQKEFNRWRFSDLSLFHDLG